MTVSIPGYRTSAIRGLEYEAVYGVPRTGARALDTSKPGLARAYKMSSFGYACIEIRAAAVAGVRLELVDQNGQPVPDHPLPTLLNYPERGWSGYDLWSNTERDRLIFGEAYWLLLGAGQSDTPAAIRRLNPITVEPKSNEFGITHFEQRVPGKEPRRYPASIVLYWGAYDPENDLGGFPPLRVCLPAVYAEANASGYVSDFFENQAKPDLLLSSDQPISQDELDETASWWRINFLGKGKRHKTGFLGGGLKPYPLGTKPSELALSDTRAENRRDICSAFQVPPALAGAWEAANFAAARQQQASFYEQTIVPRCTDYLAMLNTNLVPMYQLPHAWRLRYAFNEIPALQWGRAKRDELLDDWVETGIVSREQAQREVVGG